MFRYRMPAGLFGLALVVAACTNGEVAEATTTSTTSPRTTTTSAAESSTTTTVSEERLDLSETRWATHGPTGIHLEGGSLLWVSEPFPAGIARDRRGGLVFTDASGLWWFPAGSEEPTLVRETLGDLMTVVDTPEGPAAMMWNGGPTFYGLLNGEPVEAPPETPVELSGEGPWGKWTAANGLSAWVTVPEVELDAEGQPSEILEPARLMVARGEEIMADLIIGGDGEEWATLHDFDGQTLIVSRGPFEPAMPEETFLVMDIASGELIGSFTAGGTRATLTGDDVEWDGPVHLPDL